VTPIIATFYFIESFSSFQLIIGSNNQNTLYWQLIIYNVKNHPNNSAQSHIPASHGGKYGIKNPDVNVIEFRSNVNPLGCHPGVRRY